MRYRSSLRHARSLYQGGSCVTLDCAGERPRLLPDDGAPIRGKAGGLFAGEGLYLKTVVMPPMPTKEAAETLLLTERPTIPFPHERARMGVATGPVSTQGITYLVAVADAPLVDRLRKYNRCGPVTVVPSALHALRKRGARFAGTGIDLFVHVDATVTGVHVIGDGGVLFTRETGWSTPPTHEEQVAEIVRAFRSWRRNGETTVRGWIVGSGGLERPLRDDLAEALGITVTPYDPLADFVDGAGDGVSLAPLIGAAFADTDDIDLAPSWSDTLRRRAPRRRWPYAVAAAALIILMTGFGVGRHYFELDAKLRHLREEVALLEEAKAQFDAASARLEGARSKGATRQNGAEPIRWSVLFDTVSQLVPTSAALTGFTIRRDAANPTLTLEGIVRGDDRRRTETLWLMVGRLEEEVFVGKGRVTLALDRPDRLDSPVRFTIEGVIRTSDAPFLAWLIKERSWSRG